MTTATPNHEADAGVRTVALIREVAAGIESMAGMREPGNERDAIRRLTVIEADALRIGRLVDLLPTPVSPAAREPETGVSGEVGETEIESAAIAMWQCEAADYNMGRLRTRDAWRDDCTDDLRDHWRRFARAALSASHRARPGREEMLSDEIAAELARARKKFPGKNATFAALVEEVGELATATFEESRARVREEAVQVAVMAIRMVLDGDHTYDAWRKEKGLDPLVSTPADQQQGRGVAWIGTKSFG